MEPTELHAKFELIIYNGLVRGVNTEKYINKKNIKLQPVPPLMP